MMHTEKNTTSLCSEISCLTSKSYFVCELHTCNTELERKQAAFLHNAT